MKRKRSLPLRILIWLVTAALVFYLCVFCMVLWQEHHLAEPKDYDAIIVLGAQVKPDGTPNVQLAWRLDAAYDAWQKKRCAIVVCGAQGADEPVAEGDAMKTYLMGRGVPEEDILKDTASFNTRENLRNAAALLEGRNVRRVVIVTSDYHLPRAMRLALDEGFENVTGIPSRTLGGIHWLKNHLREPVAWMKYWAERLLGRELRIT